MNSKEKLESIIEQYRRHGENFMMTYGIKEICEFLLELENFQPKQQVDKTKKIEPFPSQWNIINGNIYSEELIKSGRAFDLNLINLFSGKLNEVIEALNKQNGF